VAQAFVVGITNTAGAPFLRAFCEGAGTTRGYATGLLQNGQKLPVAPLFRVVCDRVGFEFLWAPRIPRGELYSLTPNCQNKNEYTSVNSSICLVTGLPAPCPAFDSMRNKIGRVWLLPF
jgi:hypothetical protein